MERQLLCESDLTVTLVRSEQRLVIEVSDGNPARFDCPHAMLRAMIDGSPLQLSSERGFCLMEVRGTVVRLEFSVVGHGRKVCEFSTATLRAAIDGSASE